MAIAHVQTPTADTTATATSTNQVLGTATAGNAIMVGWRYAGSGRTVTLSDNIGNTYTSNAIEAFDAADGSTVGIGYALNIGAGSTTVTFGISGLAASLRMSVSEFSGVATSSAIDKTAGASGNSTTPASGSVTPTTNGQLFYAVCHSGSATTYTAGTDFTLNTAIPSGAGSQRLATERYIQPTAAAHNGNFTAGSSQLWAAALATFRDTAAAGSPSSSASASASRSVSPSASVSPSSSASASSSRSASPSSSVSSSASPSVAPAAWIRRNVYVYDED